MSSSEKIIIKDSCILFDLIDLGLMAHFFSLEIIVQTTPFVINEVKDSNQLAEINKYIDSGRLTIDSDGSLESIQDLFDQCIGLSYADCSVLELAIRKNGIVLSSDKTLRNESQRRKFTVRGALWIIAELHDQKKISSEEAITKLKSYDQINERAPKSEILNLIGILESKQKK